MRKIIKVFIGALIGAFIGILIEAIAIGMLITVGAFIAKARSSQITQHAEIRMLIAPIIVVAYSSTIGGILGGMIGEMVGLGFDIRRIAFKGATIGAFIGIVVGIIIVMMTYSSLN